MNIIKMPISIGERGEMMDHPDILEIMRTGTLRESPFSAGANDEDHSDEEE